MKRQQNIFNSFNFVRKIPRTESLRQEASENETQVTQPTLLHDSNESFASDAVKTTGTAVETSALPDCWSMKQYENFKKKYDGLIVHSKKIGCDRCARFHSESINMKGIHVSMEWASCSIVASGRNKTIQQASLRKKMNEHFLSKAHIISVKHLQDRSYDAITKCIDKLNDKHIDSTIKVFNIVYSLSKRSRPFSDVEDEIQLQIKNGVDLGVGLHSRKTAVKIVDHIATEIKKEIFAKIIEQKLKMCVIIDEASTISSKPVLIIFLKIENYDLSPTIFLDLVELKGLGAETIYTSLLNSLHCAGFDSEYLKNNLIAFCSDGASVMLGRNSGVGTRLKNDFPKIVIWHCLSHRLQLVLDDSVNDIKQVNHFKIFMDKIYTIFHQSNKNQMELATISEELGLQIVKIGRVLGPRWAACSLRSALAVWRVYPALYKYFSSETKHSGMAARLCNKYFLNDLALMLDILQEISLLSNALQARCLTLFRAEKLIKRSIKAFEILKESNGIFEKEIHNRVASDAFKDIHLIENHRFVSLPREKLLDVIIENMKKRLMDYDHLTSKNNDQEADNKLYELLNLLEPDTWNIQEVFVPWKAAEEKLNGFSEIFHHNIPINDFRDYVESVLQNFYNPVIPQSVQKAKTIAYTIAISSAEAERGFSRMNIIYSDKRSCLAVKNVANLMIINLVGLPLDLWDATPFVKAWLRKNHSADDNRVKQKKTEDYEDNQVAIWKFLK